MFFGLIKLALLFHFSLGLNPVTVQKALQPYQSTSLVDIPNTYVTAPSLANYSYSPLFNSSSTMETKPNTITTGAHLNHAGINYKTRWFFPTKFPRGSKTLYAGDPQSCVFSQDQQSLYILYGLTKQPGKGYIVKYNVAGLDRMNRKSMSFLRKSTHYQYLYVTQHSRSKTTRRWRKQYLQYTRHYLQVGPVITVGHGQSLSLNPQTNRLFLLQDTNMHNDKALVSDKVTAAEISWSKLRPINWVHYSLDPKVDLGGHVLTFGADGEAYFATQPSVSSSTPNRVKFYYGQLTLNQVSFNLAQRILGRAIGTHLQNISYNPRSNRLNATADGAMISVPANPDKLNHLTPADIAQFTFNSKREFEDIQFDQQGYSYLLVNRGVEILKSTQPY
ncbi:MAG: hypothetical protein L0I02_04260 [Lactobacillus sp.]|nr:hypothetical protein [Lactobacillus sp.]MDN6052756.1 hypothetical protein [Lactobacillus sp.]